MLKLWEGKDSMPKDCASHSAEPEKALSLASVSDILVDYGRIGSLIRMFTWLVMRKS